MSGSARATPALDYATPSVVSGEARELSFDLGRSSTAEFVAALTGVGLNIAAAAALVFVPAIGPDSFVERLIIPIFLLASALRLVKVAASHDQSTAVSANVEWIAVRGPRSRAARVSTPTISRCVVRRTCFLWLSRLDAIRLATKTSGGPRVTLLVSSNRRSLLATAAALNEFLGPPACATVVEHRRRRWRQAAIIAVLGASLIAAAGIGYVALELSTSQWLQTDALLVAAIVLAVAPVFAFSAWLEGHGRRPRASRLHRNNAAEWAMVIALSPLAWALRLWDKVRRRSPGPAGRAPANLETP